MKYESAKLTVTFFDSKDIITASDDILNSMSIEEETENTGSSWGEIW